MLSAKALLCLYFLALSSVYVLSQEDASIQTEGDDYDSDDVTDDYEPEIDSPPKVSVVSYFPHSPEFRRFTVADTEPIDVLVAFSNEAERDFNVTAIQASLLYPNDHRFFIQNYTRFVYHQIVKAHHEHSFLYRFLPDAGLDARDFSLAISVFYHDARGGNYSTVFFNDTISLIDRADSVNAQTFFTFLGLVGLLGLASFVAYRNFYSPQGKKARARKLIETGTRTDVPVEANEWLAGTSATSKQQQRSSAGAASPRRTRNSSNAQQK